MYVMLITDVVEYLRKMLTLTHLLDMMNKVATLMLGLRGSEALSSDFRLYQNTSSDRKRSEQS